MQVPPTHSFTHLSETLCSYIVLTVHSPARPPTASNKTATPGSRFTSQSCPSVVCLSACLSTLTALLLRHSCPGRDVYPSKHRDASIPHSILHSIPTNLQHISILPVSHIQSPISNNEPSAYSPACALAPSFYSRIEIDHWNNRPSASSTPSAKTRHFRPPAYHHLSPPPATSTNHLPPKTRHICDISTRLPLLGIAYRLQELKRALRKTSSKRSPLDSPPAYTKASIPQSALSRLLLRRLQTSIPTHCFWPRYFEITLHQHNTSQAFAAVSFSTSQSRYPPFQLSTNSRSATLTTDPESYKV